MSLSPYNTINNKLHEILFSQCTFFLHINWVQSEVDDPIYVALLADLKDLSHLLFTAEWSSSRAGSFMLF